MTFCTSCGKPLAPHEVFCTKCGHKAPEMSPSPPEPAKALDTPIAGRESPHIDLFEAATEATGQRPAPPSEEMESEKPEPSKSDEPQSVYDQEAQHRTDVSATGKGASARPRGKVNWAVVGGIAVFAVVVVALLVPGWLQRDAAVGGPASTAMESSETETYPLSAPNASDPSSSPAQTQEVTREQQALLDTLTQKFEELLPGLIKEAMDEKLFQAAAKQAMLADPVFKDDGLYATLLLPDPRAGSLNKLGIESYIPHSGAQDYINENYAKLCGMDTPDRIEMPVTFYYQDGVDGEKTLDWELFSVYRALREYSDVFTPHVDQYMADVGFYAAALELLMPAVGRWVTEGDLDSDYMHEYFAKLADALEFKGIEVNSQIVVDNQTIQNMLKQRLAQVWVCDSVSVYTNVFRAPQLKMRSLFSGAFFSRVYDDLNARYQTGRAEKPSSMEELERVFLATAQEMSVGILDSSAAKDRDLVMEREYPFDWETLGSEGILACPELVEEMRTFLFSYDFDLTFLASWNSIGTP